jgi:multiple sugar transport system substrate-binding protein
MSEVTNGISRRSVLKGAAVGGLGLAAGGSLLASCGSDSTGALAFGARTVDAGPTAQLKALTAAYTAKTKNEVTYNATESNAFQNNLSQYLQGTPDDAFQWMAGYRMQFFAEQGLLADLTGVWDTIGDQYADSYKTAATGLDGKQYFVPQSWYPWGLHFRKSMFADLGLSADTVTNWDEYLKMLDGMKKKGLVGFAAGDKGGWEAMGTFDILNARINGYQFHVDLLAGREKWTDAKVLDVFKHWEMLIPYMNPNVLDLEWDGAMQLLLQKKAGSMLMGSWFGGNFKEQSDADYADLSIIPFPEINPMYGRDTVDAPIDGFCVAANGTNNAGGVDFLKFAGDMEGVQAMLDAKDADGKSIPMTSANKGQDTSTYDAFQKEQLAVMDEAKYITQFLDRDTRPDFAGPVVGPAIQSWFKNPKDVNKIVDSLQAQWDALPPLA